METVSVEDIFLFVYDEGEVRYTDFLNEFVKTKKCAKQTFLNYKKQLEESGRIKKRFSTNNERRPVYYVPEEKRGDAVKTKEGRADGQFIIQNNLVFAKNVSSDIDFLTSRPKIPRELISADDWLKNCGPQDFPAPTHATIYVGNKLSLLFENKKSTLNKRQEEKVSGLLRDSINAIFPHLFLERLNLFCTREIEQPLTLENMLNFNVSLHLRFNGKEVFRNLSTKEKERLKQRIVVYLLLELTGREHGQRGLKELIPLMIRARLLDEDEGKALHLSEKIPFDPEKQKTLLQKLAWNHLIKGDQIKNLPPTVKTFEEFLDWSKTSKEKALSQLFD